MLRRLPILLIFLAAALGAFFLQFPFFILFALLISFHMSGQSDTSAVAITRFDKVNTDAKVYNTFIDEKNVIWLASSKGLIETTGDGSKYIIHFENTSMRDVTSDRKDNIWAASNNAITILKLKVTIVYLMMV